MAAFDEAHYYVKDLMEIPVFNVVKEMNASDAYLKLIISGGDVLNRYFDGPSIFLTHDFDLKLTADKKVVFNDKNIQVMRDYNRDISIELEDRLNEFYEKNKKAVDSVLEEKYGVKMGIKSDTGKYFNAAQTYKDGRHFAIRYQLRSLDDQESVLDEIVDLYMVLPEHITFPYNTFLGGDPMLSLDGSKYYIPATEMEGLLIAGLGFMLWDTQRMLEYSMDLEAQGKKNKLQRYIDKQKAIYNDLNHPLKRLACLPLEDYIKHCDRKSKSCTVDGRQFNSIRPLLTYAQRKGYLSKSQVSEIRKGKYSLSYLCVYINKIKEYSEQ